MNEYLVKMQVYRFFFYYYQTVVDKYYRNYPDIVSWTVSKAVPETFPDIVHETVPKVVPEIASKTVTEIVSETVYKSCPTNCPQKIKLNLTI